MKKILLLAGFALLTSCATVQKSQNLPFTWEGANMYFLLTDRFKNGDLTNDVNFGRTEKAAVLRGFEGGDLRGIIQKIDDNYSLRRKYHAGLSQYQEKYRKSYTRRGWKNNQRPVQVAGR